jgi:hypothetical protein
MEDVITTSDAPKELDWGYENPQLVTEQIKQGLTEVPGFDEDTVLKGHVFERILNDDVGEFGTASLWFQARIMKPGKAREHKDVFLNRLRWELDQPQTPKVIKDAIEEVKDQIAQTEWINQENVNAARAIWDKAVRLRAKAMVEADEEGAGQALEHYYKYMDAASKRRYRVMG